MHFLAEWLVAQMVFVWPDALSQPSQRPTQQGPEVRQCVIAHGFIKAAPDMQLHIFGRPNSQHRIHAENGQGSTPDLPKPITGVPSPWKAIGITLLGKLGKEETVEQAGCCFWSFQNSFNLSVEGKMICFQLLGYPWYRLLKSWWGNRKDWICLPYGSLNRIVAVKLGAASLHLLFAQCISCLCILFLWAPAVPKEAIKDKSAGAVAPEVRKSWQAAAAHCWTSCGLSTTQAHFSSRKEAKDDLSATSGPVHSLSAAAILCLTPPFLFFKGGSAMAWVETKTLGQRKAMCSKFCHLMES